MWINESEIASYLRDIKKIKVLSPDEEEDVIRRIKEGDSRAEHELITANLRFVITVAKEYQNQGLDFQDLIGEGNYGLVKAAKRFDSSVGVRFYSYAVNWVRQSIRQALSEHSRTVRLPVNVINDISKNKKTFTEKEYTDWCARQGVVKMHSLNQMAGEDGEELINLLVGEANLAFKTPPDDSLMLPATLQQVMCILTEREQAIVKQYYGLDGEEMTLQQIADNMELTKERVRQIKNQAIKKLRYNAPLLFKFFED